MYCRPFFFCSKLENSQYCHHNIANILFPVCLKLNILAKMCIDKPAFLYVDTLYELNKDSNNKKKIVTMVVHSVLLKSKRNILTIFLFSSTNSAALGNRNNTEVKNMLHMTCKSSKKSRSLSVTPYVRVMAKKSQ